MTDFSNGSTWSTNNELEHLRLVADLNPLQLLGAYNGSLLRTNWGSLNGPKIQAEALKLAKQAIYSNKGLEGQVPSDWFYTQRLLKELKNG